MIVVECTSNIIPSRIKGLRGGLWGWTGGGGIRQFREKCRRKMESVYGGLDLIFLIPLAILSF